MDNNNAAISKEYEDYLIETLTQGMIDYYYYYSIYFILFHSKGAYFIKHHKYGAAKLRHISLDKDLSKLYWREPNQFSQTDSYKGFIEVKVFSLRFRWNNKIRI